MEAPCKDCKDRTIPKHCELRCERWKKYREEYEKQKKRIDDFKNIKYEINSNKKRRQDYFS